MRRQAQMGAGRCGQAGAGVRGRKITIKIFRVSIMYSSYLILPFWTIIKLSILDLFSTTPSQALPSRFSNWVITLAGQTLAKSFGQISAGGTNLGKIGGDKLQDGVLTLA